MGGLHIKMTIQCRKCNKKFKNMLSFRYHNCPNEDKYDNWNIPQSRSKNSSVGLYPNWLSVENKRHLKAIRKTKNGRINRNLHKRS